MNILFLTHRLPFPPNRGDRILAYHLLRHMREYGNVDVVSLVHSPEEAAQAKSLVGEVTSVRVCKVTRSRNLVRATFALLGRTPLTHILLDAPSIRTTIRDAVRQRPPDVVVAYGSGMAQFALEAPLESLPLVVHMVDVDSAKWAALAERARPPMRWIYAREARYLSRFEAVAARKAQTTVLVAGRERDVLARLAPDARIEVVPLGVDLAYYTPPVPPDRRREVVFCGVLDYPPNVEGVLWFARRVWPTIRQQHPDARLKLVGSNPVAAVRALADVKASIEVTGSVPDVRPYLWSAAVSIAPLLLARGAQNKVLEAIAAGLPAVVTSAAAAGVQPEVLAACTIADTPEAFAEAVMSLLTLTSGAREDVEQRVDRSLLAWPRALAPFRPIVESAARSTVRGTEVPEKPLCNTSFL